MHHTQDVEEEDLDVSEDGSVLGLSPRVQVLMERDLVRTTDLRPYMTLMLDAASRAAGAEAFAAAVNAVDPVLLQQVGAG